MTTLNGLTWRIVVIWFKSIVRPMLITSYTKLISLFYHRLYRQFLTDFSSIQIYSFATCDYTLSEAWSGVNWADLMAARLCYRFL